MPLKLILVIAVATAVGCYAIKSNAAQSDSETLLTEVKFAQVFADVEAATANFDPDTASSIRHKLYSAALKKINAITYEEWLGGVAAEIMRRPAVPPIDRE
jgi:hypothetical protein